MHILLVEDSAAIQSLVKDMLASPDRIFSQAFHGEQALKALSTSVTPIDLVLLDWEMPVMDGLTTLRRIRAVDRQIPVIMVTGRIDAKSIQQALADGATDYVMKPFTRDILVAKIGALNLARSA